MARSRSKSDSVERTASGSASAPGWVVPAAWCTGLVATAIGLLVALPAVAFFNFFMRVIKTRTTRGDAISREVLAFMKSKKRQPAAAAAAKNAE